MVYFVRGFQKSSRVSIKGRLFEGSIGLRGDSIVYFVRGENRWKRSPTSTNQEVDHGTRPLTEAKSKVIRTYAQNRQLGRES